MQCWTQTVYFTTHLAGAGGGGEGGGGETLYCTANDPERKLGLGCTQVSGSSCQFYYYKKSH